MNTAWIDKLLSVLIKIFSKRVNKGVCWKTKARHTRVASSRRLHGVQEKFRTPRCAQWDLLKRRWIAVASPWHLHWTPWGLLGRHATARTLCMHKVHAVARRSHGDLNERRANAVGSQRQRSNSAVRSPRAPQGRRAHAVGTHMIAARTPPYTTINTGMQWRDKKKNIDKYRNFNFQNLIFSHFVRLNIAIKRIPHIFPWLCARDVCYIIFCHLLHIHSGKTGILFSLLLCSLWWVQIFVCLYITPSHYHHCANLSEDIELIKCLSDTFCRVCEWD